MRTRGGTWYTRMFQKHVGQPLGVQISPCSQMDYKKYFKNKRVTLIGLGLLGRGVGDAVFLAKAGAKLLVTDLKSKEMLKPSLKVLGKIKHIKFVLGEHRLKDFSDTDLVVKAAGVPLDSPYVLEAQKNNVPVEMSTALFFKSVDATVVGVTGTRGKSTVAHLMYEILKAQEKSIKKKGSAGQVYLGGNELGVSTLALLPKIKPKDKVVLELDSWQLQGFGDTHNKELPKVQAGLEDFVEVKGVSPAVAIFTTFMPDHMNYYGGDMERYFADKANIYRFQNRDEILVVSEQVMDYIERYGPKPQSKVYVVRSTDLPRSWELKILGEHNRLNAALAFATAKAMGVPDKVIRSAIESFNPVPGRLELVRSYRGVDLYNDTNSTTPEATMVALEAFGRDGHTILIFGGADKKLDYVPLLKMLPHFVKALVVLPGTGTEKMRKELEAAVGDIPISYVEDMDQAVRLAWYKASADDRILMSPGFASFGLFTNEYDRGDKFNNAVKNQI